MAIKDKKNYEIFYHPLNYPEISRKFKVIKNKLLKKNYNFTKKIAILGGSTTFHIKEYLEVFLLNEGLKPIFYESEFSSYFEESVFENKKLKKFKPDIIWIHTTFRNILNFPKISNNKNEVKKLLLYEIKKLEKTWINLKKTYNCTLIQNNFDLPSYRILDNNERSDYRGTINFIDKLNQYIHTYNNQNPWLTVFDINYLSSYIGIDKWNSKKDWYQFKYSPSLEASIYLCFDLSKIILSLFGFSKKCVVVDLDNTIWGGTIGDDGIENINLGEDSPIGEAFSEFQKYLKRLKDRGVILAAISKNDEKIAKKGFQHPNSELKYDDFAILIANWENKDKNIKILCSKLNLTPDSIVFIDDNPVERDLVSSNIPGIVVPNLTSDVTEYIDFLDKNKFFVNSNITIEDLSRNNSLKVNQKINQYFDEHQNYDEYLKSLEMESKISIIRSSDIKRIVQLANKTNQFNLTNLRITSADIEKRINKKNSILLYATLKDKFCNYGLISVFIADKLNKNEINIELWVMSCRVFNRNLENLVFNKFIQECKKNKVKKIIGRYNKSSKNKIVSTLYKNLGFIKNENSNKILWELLVKHYKNNKINSIKLINE